MKSEGRYIGDFITLYGVRLELYRERKIEPRSKYQPHQSKRECARRIA